VAIGDTIRKQVSTNEKQESFLVELKRRSKVGDKTVNAFVSHDRLEETPESKARWFQSLSLAERMEILCEIADLILSVNPLIAERKNDQPPSGRVQVLSIS